MTSSTLRPLASAATALGVAAAAADKLDVLDNAVLNVDIDLLGAGPVRLVFQFHNTIPPFCRLVPTV